LLKVLRQHASAKKANEQQERFHAQHSLNVIRCVLALARSNETFASMLASNAIWPEWQACIESFLATQCTRLGAGGVTDEDAGDSADLKGRFDDLQNEYAAICEAFTTG
jgi:hypothetical protein